MPVALEERVAHLENEVLGLHARLSALAGAGSGAEGNAESPWRQGAGMYDPNDPLVQDWLVEIQAARQRHGRDDSVF